MSLAEPWKEVMLKPGISSITSPVGPIGWSTGTTACITGDTTSQPNLAPAFSHAPITSGVSSTRLGFPADCWASTGVCCHGHVKTVKCTTRINQTCRCKRMTTSDKGTNQLSNKGVQTHYKS